MKSTKKNPRLGGLHTGVIEAHEKQVGGNGSQLQRTEGKPDRAKRIVAPVPRGVDSLQGASSFGRIFHLWL